MKERRKRSSIWLSTSDVDFSAMVSSAKNVGDLMRSLGEDNAGSGHYAVNKRIRSLGLNISHFNPKNRRVPPRLHQLSELLVVHSKGHRADIKRRLIDGGLLEKACAICSLGESWNGARLVLVLDHKNGVKDDYRLLNLRLLCPNCNSQQDTFAGRNIKTAKKQLTLALLKNPSWRKKPQLGRRKVHNRPDKDTLAKMVWSQTTSSIALSFGVTDNAVAKWCKWYGISKPGRGYWAKARSKPTTSVA